MIKFMRDHWQAALIGVMIGTVAFLIYEIVVWHHIYWELIYG